MIINLKLPTLKQNEHSEQYEDVARFIDMGNWLVDEVDKKTKILFQCSIRNKIRYHRNIYLPVLESVARVCESILCSSHVYISLIEDG